MLPEATPAYTSPAKFVDTGIEAMLAEMCAAGATPETVTAKIAGGSTMLDLTTSGGSIGDRNVEATRAELADRDITLVAEDVGGEYGRSIQFDAETTELRIKTAYQGECVI
jgi:chemotaxis protein CheD